MGSREDLCEPPVAVCENLDQVGLHEERVDRPSAYDVIIDDVVAECSAGKRVEKAEDRGDWCAISGLTAAWHSSPEILLE
jgi:hypothetical protein